MVCVEREGGGVWVWGWRGGRGFMGGRGGRDGVGRCSVVIFHYIGMVGTEIWVRIIIRSRNGMWFNKLGMKVSSREV